MKKTIRFIIVAAVILAGVGTLGLGYYGFVPGLSRVLGSATPRDLRIEPTSQDLAAAKARAGITFGELPSDAPAERSIRFSGRSDVVAEFTDEELTALLLDDRWKYNFVEKAQIRINPDGSEEISGLLRLDRVYGYAVAHRVPMGKLDPLVRRLEMLKSNPAFYVKLRSSWADDRLTMTVERAEIGRFEFPKEVLEDNEEWLRAALEKHVLAVPEVSIRSLTFTDGRMRFDGSLPGAIDWSP